MVHVHFTRYTHTLYMTHIHVPRYGGSKFLRAVVRAAAKGVRNSVSSLTRYTKSAPSVNALACVKCGLMRVMLEWIR